MVWRGHNREPNLGSAEDKLAYLEFLNQDLESDKYLQGSSLEALTLMTNHSHEVEAVSDQKLFSNHMRRHHGRYGADFNRRHGRCGKVAQDRPYTTLLESDRQKMETTFYVHANPVRAGIVKDAREYRWSTHLLYAFGKRESWMRNIVFPHWYMRLAPSWILRRRAYRQLFARYLKEKGLLKQDFLKKHFFGSNTWCESFAPALRTWKQNARAP